MSKAFPQARLPVSFPDDAFDHGGTPDAGEFEVVVRIGRDPHSTCPVPGPITPPEGGLFAGMAGGTRFHM